MPNSKGRISTFRDFHILIWQQRPKKEDSAGILQATGLYRVLDRSTEKSPSRTTQEGLRNGFLDQSATTFTSPP